MSFKNLNGMAMANFSSRHLGIRKLASLITAVVICWASGCDKNRPANPSEKLQNRGSKTGFASPGDHQSPSDRRGREKGGEANLRNAAADWQKALERGDNEAAWKAACRLLVQRQPTAKEVWQIARVAYETDRREAAAELLLGWIREAEHLSDAEMQRTIAVLLHRGQLFEAIDALRVAVDKRPEQNEWRRQLFDFLIAVERRRFAIDHGRQLIRRRYFDLQVLRSLSVVENRDVESASVGQLRQRNPEDGRLLIADAREAFDTGQWERCGELLKAIFESHPDDPAALAMQGRVLVRTANFSAIPAWSERAFSTCRDDWRYWITLGDAARRTGRHDEAAACFLQATRLDSGIEESWAKLGTALRSVSTTAMTSKRTRCLRAIEDRTQHLAQLHHLKSELQRFGNRDLWRFGKIAEHLEAIGCLWEAEAWLAIGIQKAGQSSPQQPVSRSGVAFDPSDLSQQRQRLLTKLRPQTPWQVTAGHPELSLSFEDWGLESPESWRPFENRWVRGDDADFKRVTPMMAAVPPRLANEADVRGLSASQSGRHYRPDSSIPLHGTFESGLGVIDFDLDGWPDLHIAVAGKHPIEDRSIDSQLFRNRDGVFSDVTSRSRMTASGFGQGVAVGDVNADGFADVFLLRFGTDRLLINQGDGTFLDASERLGPQDPNQWSTSGAIADLNADGVPDLIVLRYCRGEDALAEDCRNRDGKMMACVPTKFPAAKDRFLQGTPDGRFEDVTEAWIPQPPPPARGLGIVVGNLDADPGLEVFVANDMTSNHLYQSEWPTPNDASSAASFRLREAAMSHGVANNETSDTQACMGVAVGDLDGDQKVDLFVTNFAGEHNTFYRQEPGGVWSDRSVDFGVVGPSLDLLGFGAHAVDFDGDGKSEIAITNGHIYTEPEDGSTFFQPFQILGLESPLRLVAMDIEADGRGGNHSNAGYVESFHSGRAMAVLDADRNGLPDLAITHQTEPVALLMNRTPTDADRLRLQLRGVRCDRDAIGAVIDVRRGESSYRHVVVAGDGFMCTNEDALDIGLGHAASANDVDGDDVAGDVRVEVQWPHGRSEHHRLRANTQYVLVEGMPPFRVSEPVR